MKSYIRFAAIAGTLSLTACGGASASSGETTLRFADWFPDSHIAVTEGSAYWMDLVTERTNGQVKFDHYPAEQLGKSTDFLSMLQAGATDGAALGTAYYSSELPISGVGSLPGMYEKSCDGTRAYWDVVNPSSDVATTELSDQGVHPLFAAAAPPYELLTSSTKVESPEDAAGLKVRSSGGTYQNAVEAVGAAPIQLTSAETYEGISRGTVDGVLFSYSTAMEYSLEEVVNYGTDGASFGGFTIIYGLKSDVWEQLSPENQEILQQAGVETMDHLCESFDEETATAKEAMTEQGVEISELSNSERNAWSESLSIVREDWLDNGNFDKEVAEDALKDMEQAAS
ncbi:TRAP transporter substrate-binding protein DctP [Brevibacterium luteolum]|uniref:TRAP transporter substrate-binding protein n=1 Tax=Brevibacterium luteolum TaxID=199591 RepID=UPI0021AEE890|nr:TRAP transporter substrate-binding protein DctP [Brevibacterium luteolum]MCT1658291.1 TRAP transporter substrate-binding protein DctP [Brevibacterium luteolum]